MTNPKVNDSTFNTLQTKYKIAVLGDNGGKQGPEILKNLVRGEKVKEKFFEIILPLEVSIQQTI